MEKYIKESDLFKKILNVDFKHDYDGCVKFCQSFPAADVVEVRHGRWTEEDDAIIHGHCSSCGWNAIWQETDVFGMPYCPNCGAKMDEVTE